jgi:DNA-binding CsgD family transcriptional regulator
MTDTSAAAEVVGREEELAAIERFAALPSAGARALLLTGAAGIGKTTLWRWAVERCRRGGERVLVATPAESELELPFAALNDLLADLLDDFGGALPERRRQALDVALLRSAGTTTVDRLAVALAVFDLLRAAVCDQPLLIAIDDMQWLDAPSAAACDFAFRRLQGERVALVCSDRESTSNRFGLGRERITSIEIGPLSAAVLGRIVTARTGAQLSRPAVARLGAVSGGNPFFALEIARALGPTVAASDDVPLPTTVTAAARTRLLSLSPECRQALLVLAALGQSTNAAVDAIVPAYADRIGEALDAGILEVERERVRFSHPLLASTVYADAPAERRRATHRALARVVDDPEQRALHLARGTAKPDERVATAIERAAARAAARGAPQTAAELAEHARRLTPSDAADAAVRRALTAAGFMWSAGDGRRSEAMLADLISQLPRSAARARARCLLVKIVDDIATTIAELELALEDASGDAAVTASVRILLARQRAWAGDTQGAIREAEAGAAVAERAGMIRELASALGRGALARVYAGEPTPHEQLERALALEQKLQDPLPVEESPTFFRGVCAMWENDLATARQCLEAADERAARLGESWRLVVLTNLIELELQAGDSARALRYAVEAEDIGAYWGVGHAYAAALASAALAKAAVGSADEARAAASQALDAMRPYGYEIVIRPAERALGHLELALGNVAAAHAALGPLLARVPIASPPAAAAAGDEIEALLELGRIDEAQTLLAKLADHARTSGRARATAVAARCAGLLAAHEGDLAAAAGHLGRALAVHESFTDPLELGRTQLALGLVERRRKHKAEAREALARASELFELVGAQIWKERAHSELQRTGISRRRDGELTPTEQRIAILAARGATNREIATQMFITVKTVEANLSRIYGKIGVRSRTELASRIQHHRDASQTISIPQS